jgi:hypothetical protein
VGTLVNGKGTIIVSRPGFVVTISWDTLGGRPVRITADEIIQYIDLLSSKFAQNGGVPGLNNLNTASFVCGTYGTPACPQPPWLSTNTGKNDDATRDHAHAAAPGNHIHGLANKPTLKAASRLAPLEQRR